ncbi:MAG: CRTAC1 family protein [Acidobacteriota bacterium]|nr:MAG: CRTAC1 family protein [Acidobacteriota bacterium]
MNRLIATVSVLFAAFGASCGTAEQGVGPEEGTSNITFADRTVESGIDFKHIGGRSESKWMPEVLGGGVAIADFDIDGDPDILLVNSGNLNSQERPSEASNRLYINDGKGKFTDRTADWRLPGVGYGQGAAVGDFDGDGATDVFLTDYFGNNRLLRNTGSAFEDVTEKAGIQGDGKWATSAGFADLDNDGDLDIFVVKYVSYSQSTHVATYKNGLQTYSAPYLYEAVGDQIWENVGDGKFADASEKAGITGEPEKGLALAIGDIDLDGDQDVYVANDSTPNQLWINDGKGVFEDRAKLGGAAYSEIGREEGSMGADFGDLDSNGLPDIVVTNFQEESTALYTQEEPMFFREVSDAVGIGATARQRLKFGMDLFDADNDGDDDLLVANGHIEDNIEKNSDSITFAQPNSLYENLGNGKFKDISESAGDALKDVQVSRGLATADLDGDGDLDYVIVNNGGTAQIAFNETGKKGNFAFFFLRGNGKNTNAIGARLVAKIGDRTIERQVMGAQSYLSVSDFRVHFGLGDASKIDGLTIHWPGGEKQTLRDVAGNKFYYIKQGGEPREFVPGTMDIEQ